MTRLPGQGPLYVMVVLLCLLAPLPRVRLTHAASRHRALRPQMTSVGVSRCPVTPFQSRPSPYPGLTHVPWVKAQPAAAGITGYLFRVPRGSPRGTVPLQTGMGKILWRVDRDTQGTLEIRGRNLSQERETLHQVVHRASGIDYPSGPVFPTPGCWQLVLRTNDDQGRVTTATVTFLVVRAGASSHQTA